jgi:hypothetical protein
MILAQQSGDAASDQVRRNRWRMSLMEINLSERQRRHSHVKCGRVNLRYCVGESVRAFLA